MSQQMSGAKVSASCEVAHSFDNRPKVQNFQIAVRGLGKWMPAAAR